MADENKKAVTKNELDNYVTENKILTKSKFISGEYLSIKGIRNQASEVIAGDVAVYDPFIDDIRYVVLNTDTDKTITSATTCDYYCIPLGVVIYPFSVNASAGGVEYDFCSILSIKNGSGILPENGTKQDEYTVFGSILYNDYPSFLRRNNISAIVYKNEEGGFTSPTKVQQTDVIFPREVDSDYTGTTIPCPRDSKACYNVAATADTTERLVVSPYDYGYQGTYDDTRYLNANIDMTEQYSQYPEWLDENLPDEYLNWRDVSTIPYFNSVTKLNNKPYSPGYPSIVGACRFMPITINGQKIVWGMPTLFHALAFNVRHITITKIFESLNSPFLLGSQSNILGEYYDKTGVDTFFKTFPLIIDYYILMSSSIHKYAACVPFSFK